MAEYMNLPADLHAVTYSYGPILGRIPKGATHVTAKSFLRHEPEVSNSWFEWSGHSWVEKVGANLWPGAVRIMLLGDEQFQQRFNQQRTTDQAPQDREAVLAAAIDAAAQASWVEKADAFGPWGELPKGNQDHIRECVTGTVMAAARVLRPDLFQDES